MKPELVKITPKLAKEWLAYNAGNRDLPAGNCKYYQRLIESNQFKTTHQGLAFTGSRQNPGRLIDGQTRLNAIFKSGIVVEQWVFWECPEEIFECIDGGKPRSFMDHHGWKKDRISFCNFMWRMSNSGQDGKMTKADADLIWDGFGELFSELMANCPTHRKSISPTAVRAAVVLAMHQNIEKKDEIADQYRHMVLGAIECMAPSIGRLMVKLLSIHGGGGGVQALQFAFSHKAFTPKNWGVTKLYGPDDDYCSAVKEYIKAASTK